MKTQNESLAAFDAGQLDNGDCFNRSEIELPDGYKNAVRAMEFKNRKTGIVKLSGVAPWLLCGIF